MIFPFLWLISCSGKQEDTAIACVEAAPLEWNYWADGFFRTYCHSCHSSQSQARYGAPEGMNFDSQEDVETFAELIYHSVLVEESMPKGGGVDPEELRRLEAYLRCWLGVEP